ncbi:hypothetical protein [Photobacterium leiognathi]|nr:hypothetical protein [Photobacterium leiognathi]
MKQLLNQLDALQIKIDKSIDSLEKLSKKTDKSGEEAVKAGKKYKKAGKDSQAFGKSAKSTGDMLGGAMKTGILAASVAIAAYAVQATAAISETKQLADNAQLGYEQFQSLSNAFKTVGVDAEQTSDIIRDLGIRMGEAIVHQSGEAYEVMNKLGISMDQIKDKTPEEQLMIVAGRMDEMNISGNEARAMYDQLGSDLDKMYPLLKNNAAGLKEMQAEFDKLNVVMSDADAETLQGLTNEFGRAKRNLDDLVGTIVAGMAPAITELLQDFQRGMKYVADLNEEFLIAERAGILLSGAFKFIGGALKTAYSGFLTVVNIVAAVHQKMAELALYAGSQFAAAFQKPTAVIIETWNNLLAELTGILAKFLGTVDEYLGDKAPDWVKTTKDAMDKLSKDSATAAANAAESAKTASAEMSAASEVYAAKSKASLQQAEDNFKDWAAGTANQVQTVVDTTTKLITVTKAAEKPAEDLNNTVTGKGTGGKSGTFLTPFVEDVSEVSKLLAEGDLSAKIKLLEQQLDIDKKKSDPSKHNELEAQMKAQKELMLMQSAIGGMPDLGEDPIVVAMQKSLDAMSLMNDEQLAQFTDHWNKMNGVSLSAAEIQASILETKQEAEQAAHDASMARLEQAADYSNAYVSQLEGMISTIALMKDGTDGVLKGVSSIAGQMSANMEQDSAAYKALAITQATIDAYLAIQKALAEGGPYLGPIMAGVIGGMAFANVAEITKAKDGASMVGMPRYASGTSFVDGAGTSKSDDVPAMLSRGESVLTKSASESIGRANIDAMNKGGGMPTAGGGGSVAVDAPLIIQGNVDSSMTAQLNEMQQKQVEKIASQVTMNVTRIENKSGGIFKKYGRR